MTVRAVRLAAAAMMLAGSYTTARCTDTALYSFTGKGDGDQPRGDVLMGADGELYGTTSSGGAAQNGTVFRVVPARNAQEETLYQFTGGDDGSLPSAGLLQDASGALFGTAARGGRGRAGTVFRLDPPASGQGSWTETTLWGFTGRGDGDQPVGSLISDRSGSGVLYGTTTFGGMHKKGVVFSLTPPADGQGAWHETVLWSFTGKADGARPVAALVQGADGTLYGTAEAGGASHAGTVFELVPNVSGSGAWTFTTIWSFSGGADGASPTGTLILDPAGNLYGTTEFGGGADCGQARYPYYNRPKSETDPALNADYVPVGGNHCGVVFTLKPPVSSGGVWTQTVDWSFRGGGDGANPVAALLLGDDGSLYGMTPEYGDLMPSGLGQYGDKGNIFELTPTSSPGMPYAETTLLSFDAEGKGTYARGSLTLGSGGTYYATKTFGGASWVHGRNYGYGAVISFKP